MTHQPTEQTWNFLEGCSVDKPPRFKVSTTCHVNTGRDMFGKDVPDELIDKAFAIMALCPQHTFLLSTEHAKRMREYLSAPDLRERMGWAILNAGKWQGPVLEQAKGARDALADLPLPNVWIGVSVEDQTRADERIPDLLATPAAVRWISAEPLLGPILLQSVHSDDAAVEMDALNGTHGIMRPHLGKSERLDWVIIGGESGPKARLMHPDWVRSIRDQCAEAGVPFCFNGWGEWFPRSQWDHNPELILPDDEYAAIGTYGGQFRFDDGEIMHRVGKLRAGRALDGVEHNSMPEVKK